MKRSLLSLAAIAALPIVASAQSQSATVNVKATVASSVTITAINNTIDFGTTGLTPGAAASVPASGTSSYQSSIVANEQVNVAIPTTTVSMTGGTGSFNVTLSCGTAASSNAATTTAMASCAGSVPAGTTYFYVGASIASGATTSAPAGNYTGSTTLNYTWTAY